MKIKSGNGQIKCDGDFSSRVYDKYEEYIEGLTSSTTTGFGIELGRSVSGSISRNGTKASAGIPPIFSRSWGDNKDVEKVRNFFTKEQGSISVTEAICLTHRVDIADAARKVLLQGFIDSVVSLESFSDVNRTLQEAEFRRFVNEYGTHYQTTSKLGTRNTFNK
ncbi:uncharacterized protein LOC111706201 [Eurytemora carolleeae]|uniref:uncharacterized protein LOC111706201 n=1 Tax=Eurytemora carolleeae TaxID=1294199 RepID=UPI000C76D081|nr:uncharacterized protein LOC111706201 [Eurytemora carolleeae]|eukprot:XP_023334770.1 uncharacterized protein LOC111706201 [Eurytemora affinis]